MTIDDLNELPPQAAGDEFLKCCGSTTWARAMAQARPLGNEEELFIKADQFAAGLKTEDWLEAFRAHPKIGERKAAAAQSQQANPYRLSSPSPSLSELEPPFVRKDGTS